MAGELIATGAQGLGHLQDTARASFDTAQVLAVMVVIILIGMAVEALFSVATVASGGSAACWLSPPSDQRPASRRTAAAT